MDAGTRSVAKWTRTLAHSVRLGILRILAQEGECCVCHLTAALRQRQPLVSQSLRVLKDNGLVQDRRDGYMVYYSLADPAIVKLIHTLTDVASALGVRAPAPPPVSPLRDCTCPACSELRQR